MMGTSLTSYTKKTCLLYHKAQYCSHSTKYNYLFSNQKWPLGMDPTWNNSRSGSCPQRGLHLTVLGLQSTFCMTIEMSVFWRGLTPVSFPMYSRNDFCLKNSPKESIFQQASGSCETRYWLLMAWIRIHRR